MIRCVCCIHLQYHARKMYSKLGYKELSILPTIYNGLPHVNLVLMEKYIGGHA